MSVPPLGPSLVARITNGAARGDHFCTALAGLDGATLNSKDLSSLNRTRGITNITPEDELQAALQRGYCAGATPITDIGEHYLVGDMLGKGRFATVYRGFHGVSGEKHALKVISTTHLMDHGVKLLERETDIIRMVDHPNIVKCMECFESKDEIVIAMELLEGMELFDAIIEAGEGFSEAKSSSITRDVVSGIAYLNKLGAAHRDIKPENLVFGDKAHTIVKITDLGMAKMLVDDSSLTPCGTVAFMAPEVLTVGSPEATCDGYSFACDIWSMGCVLYTLLVGYPPFFQQPPDLYEAVCTATFDFQDFEAISEEAQDLISKILVVDHTQRLTPDEVLSHPWMKGHAPKETTKQLKETQIDNLKRFVTKRKKKRRNSCSDLPSAAPSKTLQLLANRNVGKTSIM